MTPSEKADAVKRLLKDETYLEVMREVRDRQHAIFDKPESKDADVAEAHTIIRALGKIDSYIRSLTNDAAVANKRENQHRG